MAEVTVRELRNRGGQVLERVARGETLVVTLDGRPIAELRPLPTRALRVATLVERWRGLPRVDVVELRSDIARVVDPAL